MYAEAFRQLPNKNRTQDHRITRRSCVISMIYLLFQSWILTLKLFLLPFITFIGAVLTIQKVHWHSVHMNREHQIETDIPYYHYHRSPVYCLNRCALLVFSRTRFCSKAINNDFYHCHRRCHFFVNTEFFSCLIQHQQT